MVTLALVGNIVLINFSVPASVPKVEEKLHDLSGVVQPKYVRARKDARLLISRLTAVPPRLTPRLVRQDTKVAGISVRCPYTLSTSALSLTTNYYTDSRVSSTMLILESLARVARSGGTSSTRHPLSRAALVKAASHPSRTGMASMACVALKCSRLSRRASTASSS